MSRIRRVLLGCCVGTVFAAAGFASAEEDGTRAVTILDGAPLAAPAPPPPAAAVPDSPAPPPPPPDKPSDSGPAPAARPSQSAPQIETGPAIAPARLPDVPRKSSPAPVRLTNSAELSVDMTPGGTVSIGSRVSFRITSKKPGYVVLVDVDATGKLTQIYPNLLSPARSTRSYVNFIRPGVPLLIPSAQDALGGVAYLVSPPAGSAMVIAIWSEQAVQSLDLPDIPIDVKSQNEALDYLTKRANELRIPDARSGRLREANWSFDAKFYAIR